MKWYVYISVYFSLINQLCECLTYQWLNVKMLQGLGKTIQSLCFLEQLRVSPAARVYGPFLIVAPLSLVNQWQSECATWAPDLNLILYHGSSNARQFLYENEFYYTEQFTSKTAAQKLKRQHITKFHILITTYEVVMKDLAIFSKIRYVYNILLFSSQCLIFCALTNTLQLLDGKL